MKGEKRDLNFCLVCCPIVLSVVNPDRKTVGLLCFSQYFTFFFLLREQSFTLYLNRLLFKRKLLVLVHLFKTQLLLQMIIQVFSFFQIVILIFHK